MKLLEYLKEKKLGLFFLLLSFFLLLVAFLMLRDNLPKMYPISIFLIGLIFIFSQYFDFGYKYFICCALVLLIACPLFLFFKLNNLAEYFANYSYGFVVLSVIGYFFDNLRRKLKLKEVFKIDKKVFLSILVISLLLFTLIFIKSFYGVVIKENFIRLGTDVKDKYIKTFNKDIYYSNLDTVEIDGKEITRDIVINIGRPKANSVVSKVICLSGWAIETNSKYNTGIDRIEFFLDGKPDNGKYLGKFSIINNYSAEIESKNYIINLYSNFYNRLPTVNELNFWAINLEYNLISYYEVASTIIEESKFMDKSLSNEDFLSYLYYGLLNRNWDEVWINRLETDLTRGAVLYSIMNSEEFKKYSELYYENISVEGNVSDVERSIRKDVAEKYGKQFYLSGFNVYLDGTNIENGRHSIYIYAQSPIFGWDYKALGINIKN